MESYTRKKISFLKRHGGQVALDDFGAGYNGEVSLLAVRPDFIKAVSYTHLSYHQRSQSRKRPKTMEAANENQRTPLEAGGPNRPFSDRSK